MNQEIYNQIQEDEQEEVYIPKPRKTEDPKNAFEYCQYFSRIINMPVGFVLKRSVGWPPGWHISLYSELKSLKEPLAKKKYIFWFLREARVK